MDFYAGDAAEIGEAFTTNDFARLEMARAHADFSLHLSPTDLDLLSEAACELTDREQMGLLDSLKESVGGDGSESGADTVDEAWVMMFAAFPDDRVQELAGRWLRAVAEDREESESEVTPDVLQAIRDLLSLCRIAQQEAIQVVHTWSL